MFDKLMTIRSTSAERKQALQDIMASPSNSLRTNAKRIVKLVLLCVTSWLWDDAAPLAEVREGEDI